MTTRTRHSAAHSLTDLQNAMQAGNLEVHGPTRWVVAKLDRPVGHTDDGFWWLYVTAGPRCVRVLTNKPNECDDYRIVL